MKKVPILSERFVCPVEVLANAPPKDLLHFWYSIWILGIEYQCIFYFFFNVETRLDASFRLSC